MIENSPRPSRVRPTLKDVAAGCPATLPANCPAMITPTNDRKAAPIYGEEYVLIHRDPEYELRFGISSAAIVEQIGRASCRQRV